MPVVFVAHGAHMVEFSAEKAEPNDAGTNAARQSG